jgi:CubicO group peptidase (beta-lactamase class C family)
MDIKAIVLCIVGLLSISCHSSASMLSDLATSMEEKAWIKVPMDSSLANKDLHNDLMAYSDSGSRDPSNRNLNWIGGSGASGTPPRHRTLAYDEVLDTWNREIRPSEDIPGHGYGGNESTFELPPELFLPEQVLESDRIPSSWNPVQLEKISPGLSEEDFTYEYEGQKRHLTDFFSDAEVRSFIIMKDGYIVYEYYEPPYNRYSKQQSWSIAKQILSILVGIAIDEGAIDSVEDPMDQYDPRLRDNGFAGVSFRQALQMSSGIKYDEKNDRVQLFFDIIDNYYTLGSLGHTLVEKTTAPELVREYEPDSRWQYASINSQAIAMALTAAVGEPLQDYLWKKLWDPMGMEDGAKILVDREHTEFTFCCLYATTRSYAAIGQLYANGGYYNGKQIVSQDWVRRSTTLDDPHSWSGEYVNPEGISSDNFGFAYHWWPLKGDRGDFTALGVYGQSIHVLPKQNTVVVRTSGDFEVEGSHSDEALVLGRAIADYLDPAH